MFMKVMGYIFISILGLALLVGLTFGLEYLDIVRFGIFEPKRENIRREVFENTKSYTHGVAMDLAKYFDEYQKADDNRQEAIRQIILMRFAEFDASKLQSTELQRFLINMRGY
jgi:hypothetical protein